jgi:hypothetical protein
MPISPQQFLEQAKAFSNIAKGPGLNPAASEGFARTSISRAYYTVYHMALEWAQLRGYRKGGNCASHHCLWSYWFGHEPECAEIKLVGRSLHAKRVCADYKIAGRFDYDPAEVMVELGELIDAIQKDVERLSKSGQPFPQVAISAIDHRTS